MRYKPATGILCVLFCFFVCGCVMIESYYAPLPGQGKLEQDFVTWNKPNHLKVDLSSHGHWLIIQRLEGWQNILHVQISLHNASDAPVSLGSDEVVLTADGKQYAHKLSEYPYKGAPRILWESSFDVDFGKETLEEFTLVLPSVTFNGQKVSTQPLHFKRKKGPIFYRILQ